MRLFKAISASLHDLKKTSLFCVLFVLLQALRNMVYYCVVASSIGLLVALVALVALVWIWKKMPRNTFSSDTTDPKVVQTPTNAQTSSTLDLAYESIDPSSELQRNYICIPDNGVPSVNILELHPCPMNLRDDILPVYEKTIPKDWNSEKHLTHSYLSMEDHISHGHTLEH